MLASLLARYSAHGQREVDRYAAWLAAVRRLRDNWESGERPSARELRDYLGGVPEDQRADAAQDLIAEHLRLTWEVGTGARLEAYLTNFNGEFSEVTSLAVVSAELVEDEFLARYQLPHGDTPLLREYQQRFPARADVMGLLARRCVNGGRFVKLHKRGLGAFGEVLEAHDHGLPSDGRGARGEGRRVAIKEPRSDLRDQAEALRRFAEEAHVTDGLEHPGIVALREHHSSDGSAPMHVMRLVNGETLSQRIRDCHLRLTPRTVRGQRRLWDQLLQSFVMVCEAMTYAHARGVLHRDLKPGNILIEDGGDAVILDWGMAAKQLRVRELIVERQRPELAGTPDYMPPEQADGLTDIRSDVFGLGAILYEILTGRSPHGWSDGARPADWRRLVRQAQFQPARQLRPQTPRTLEAICMKALAREPEHRYQSAAELANDVRHYLTGEQVSVWKKLLCARASRWLRGFAGQPAFGKRPNNQRPD